MIPPIVSGCNRNVSQRLACFLCCKLVGIQIVGQRGDGQRRIFGGGDAIVAGFVYAETDVARGNVAGGGAEADQVEAQVDGGTSGNAGENNPVGAAAVGLEVEQRIAVNGICAEWDAANPSGNFRQGG